MLPFRSAGQIDHVDAVAHLMRILVATDTWRPQVNGVVRSLEALAAHAPPLGAKLTLLSPNDFRSIPMPGYREIRLAFATPRKVARVIREHEPDYIHIATEGPVGLATRAACLREGRHFTTAYHTRFPEYASSRLPVPESIVYGLLRRFHRASARVLVATATLKQDLRARGFRRMSLWSRGVDTELFRPRPTRRCDFARPVFLNVGRLAVEKNLDAFLRLPLPGTKVVVGDGPESERLKAAFPETHFLGPLQGEALAAAYAAADVFVFPSRTDTFGLVLLEALASGLPIAAYPVMGPLDVIGNSDCGVLDEDLGRAAVAALSIPRQRCRDRALGFSWTVSAGQFLDALRSGGTAEAQLPVPSRAKSFWRWSREVSRFAAALFRR
jgi:glycosyltransferase involved in cell wall biosynthesis